MVKKKIKKSFTKPYRMLLEFANTTPNKFQSASQSENISLSICDGMCGLEKIHLAKQKKVNFPGSSRNFAYSFLLLISLLLFSHPTHSQNCGPTTPSLNVNLTTTSLWQSGDITPSGNCCGMGTNYNCIELVVTLPTHTNSISIGYTTAPGSHYYMIDCGTPVIAPQSNLLNLCFDQPGATHRVTFCRTGNAPYMFNVAPFNPSNLVTLAPFSPVCINTPQFVLSGGSPLFGVYRINGQPSSVFNPATIGTGVHTITYTWEDENTGCSGQATRQITVGPLQPIVWTGLNLCDRTGWIALNQATPPGGVYTGNLVVSNRFDLGSALPGVYPIRYTFTDASGCFTSRTANIVVHQPPVADAGPDQVINTGMPTILTAASGGSGSYSYHWSPENMVHNPNDQSTLTENLDQSTLFTLTVTDNNNMCQAKDHTVVNILGGGVHISELIPSPPSICIGQSTELWAIPGGGSGNYNYFWEASPPDPTLLPNVARPVVRPTVTTRYSVTISDVNDPSDWERRDVYVTVLSPPTVTLNLTPSIVCANTPGTSLSGGFPIGGTYSLHENIGDPPFMPHINLANFLPHHIGQGNYFVRYEYTDPNGCTSSAVDTFTILPFVKAEFFTSLSDICTSNVVTILNNSIGATSFSWDYGGSGTIASGPYPNSFNYIYNPNPAVQERTIRLTASNNQGCSSTRQRSVTVSPPIVANFMPDVAVGCSPLRVNFENRSTGPISYHYWSFGDGNFSTELNPIHTFTNTSDRDTVYTVTLHIVSTNFFCSEVFTWDITVHPDIEAGFSFTPAAGCSPFDLEIRDMSRGADFYSWDMGDGTQSTSSGPVLTHTYNNTGLVAEQFTIRQVVTNQAGCVDSLERILTVYPRLEASFVASETEGCANLLVEFTNTSTLTAQQFFWNFGDGGTSSVPNPRHTFKNATNATIIYEVSLTVVSADFCEDIFTMNITVHPYLEPRFDFHPAQACNPHEVIFFNRSFGANSFEWNFGDGTVVVTNDTLPLTHVFDHNDPSTVEYEVFLTVFNGQGCLDSISRNIAIFPKIIADFTSSATEGCDGLDVQFTNNSVGVLEYLWDFGDGGTSTEPNPSHIFENTSYTDIAIYDVWLFTESAYQCRDSINQLITVYPRINADFSIEIVEGCSPFTVNIRNYSKGVSIYSWDFGGIRTSNTDSTFLTHTFYNTTNNIATYTIELIVENGYGCTDTISQEIRVFPEVRADFSHLTEGCHPLNVTFTNLSENADHFFWEFGDGKESSLANPAHTYFNMGHLNDTVFNIQMLAESIHGCFAIASSQIRVNPKPDASFRVENSPGCSPYEIEITNSSQGVTGYFWNFGDGTPVSNADGALITHTFNHPYGTGTGYYDIELIVVNLAGCSDTIVQQVIIYPNIVAGFTTNFTEGCHPLTIEFNNNSTGADAQFPYFWDYGDGNTSANASQAHTHTFNNFSHTRDTVFEVMLVAQNINGCTDTTRLDITVFAKPLAFFNIPHAHACAPYEINIHNFSVGADSYLWNISDGTQYTYSSSHFNHILNQAAGLDPGVFTINLDIQNNRGCTDSFSQQVIVFPEVIADFITDNEGCHPHTSIFENQSVGADIYHWSFGNGNTSQANNPEQLFLNYNHTESQTYTVTLHSESRHGCTARHTQEIVVRPVPKPAFEFSEIAGCSPFTPEIRNLSVGATGVGWDFGNGVSDEPGASFNHTWLNQTNDPLTFNNQLRVWNVYGCEASIGQIIKVFPEVTADFGSQGNLWEGCTPLDLRFLNQSSLATTYRWDFDNGGTSRSANPPHVFINRDVVDRVFDVELTATSLFGCTDTTVRQVTVFPSPQVYFTITPYKQPYPDATITLTNLTNPGNWNFHWEFGDGNYTHTTSFDPFPHTYIWDGTDMSTKTYTVALMASNGQCSGLFTQLVTITSPIPIAGYTAELSGCEPFPVAFTNHSQFAHSFWWDFGDGAISAEPNPTHTFLDSGIYDVRLIAIGDGGRDTIYQRVEVLENPTAEFELVSTLVKIPQEPLRLINKSKLGDFFLWDFGDGNTSNAFEPVHYYRHPGIYDITLTVTRATTPQCHAMYKRSNALRVDETCRVIFPNAFKPSINGPSGGYFDMGNPSTEVFHPVYEGIADYVLEIYTRWGELIFRSEDINIGWDGYVDGQLAGMGVYVWKVTGRCTNGSKIHKAGDVTLYR